MLLSFGGENHVILTKYQHVQTPNEILQYLEDILNEKDKAFGEMDYKEYVAETTKPQRFLKDSLRYRHEKGKKSNTIPFNTYFPTFQTLDPYRRDFYFYWRSEAVKGNFLPTELSYIFLFVYELVNYGFSSDAAFNISMMENLYRQYIYRYPKLENYLPNWMADFLLEAGETELASEWISLDNKENKEYRDLKLYDDSLKSLSMNSWWKYITERSRSPFLTKHKQKVYNAFKEATFFLHLQYKETSGEGIFEKMFPLQKVGMPRQLYVSCLVERTVSFENLMVERRVFDQNYGLFLSELMRVCENVVRKQAGEENLLTIRNERISEKLANEVSSYLEELEHRSRFKKVADGSSSDKGSFIPPPETEKVEVVLDFNRIETLKEESDEFQKIYEDKYGDETEEVLFPKKETLNISDTPVIETVFVPEKEEDTSSFVLSLSPLEKEFLCLYRNQRLTVEETKSFLKQKGMMFGTFLINLNEKAEEHLGDILLEEDEDELDITEEFSFILNEL